MSTPPKRHADELDVDEHLVRRLLRDQFPQWADLLLRVLAPTGTDHTIYRLGDELVVRVPIMAYGIDVGELLEELHRLLAVERPARGA